MDLDTFIKVGGWIVSLVLAAFVVIDRIKKNSFIEYKLNDLIKKVDDIKNKLDEYDVEIDKKIKEAIETHIAIYHKEHKGD